MSWHPFDTQHCRMVFKPNGISSEFVKLTPKSVTYSGREELKQYRVTNISIFSEDDPNDPEKTFVIVEFVLIHRLQNIMLTVFLPTLILVIISFVSTLFQTLFDDIVVVNLTVILVLVTMFSSVSSINLPIYILPNLKGGVRRAFFVQILP